MFTTIGILKGYKKTVVLRAYSYSKFDAFSSTGILLNIFWGDFFSYNIQHCFICRPSDSTVPTDAGIEPRTVATCIGSQTL
jgi:hypothetical protein